MSYILKVASFRPIRDDGNSILKYTTVVIRTSIDRDDLSLAICPIPRKEATSFNRLYYLLNQSIVDVPGTQDITPSSIPKTIVFIDSINRCEEFARWLQRHLVLKTSSWQQEHYINDSSPTSVTRIIRTFHSRVSLCEKVTRYEDFRQEGSRCRIIVATTSMGTGINIADIQRVVMWKLPIDSSPTELWQRAGRGGRGEGQTSEVHIFVPY